MEIYRQRKRQDTATITELAREGNMDPNKLLACVRETHPGAQLRSPITSDALSQAFTFYEKRHGIKQSGVSEPKMQNGAPPVKQPGQIQHEVNTMSNSSNDFYDEPVTDVETKRLWENNPGIREEFHGNYESFKHFRRAEAQGSINIMGGK